MAKKSLKVKQARPQKYKTREYNRCKICGRPHAYIRKNITDAKFAEDHMLTSENTEFAVYALEN